MLVRDGAGRGAVVVIFPRACLSARLELLSVGGTQLLFHSFLASFRQVCGLQSHKHNLTQLTL